MTIFDHHLACETILGLPTEAIFTRSESLIRIQCGLAWAPQGTQTSCIALLDWISPTVTQYSEQLGSESRSYGGNVVFGSGFPIRIGSGSKVPCGKPQYELYLVV